MSVTFCPPRAAACDDAGSLNVLNAEAYSCANAVAGSTASYRLNILMFIVSISVSVPKLQIKLGAEGPVT